ncbi:hypothetical protein ACHAWF_002260 [Thalassiosira exigua]
MGSVNQENDEEECLRRFGNRVLAFYGSSLTLSPSSSSLSLTEEKKSDDKNLSIESMNRRGDEGKIVLEALDRISAIRSATAGMALQRECGQQHVATAMEKSIVSLRQEHNLIAESNRDLLFECGLLDMDRFLTSTSLPDDEKVPCLLQQYTLLRDAMRRRAHKISMLHRQRSFFEVLSDSLPEECAGTSPPRMIQLKHVQNSLSIIQHFVNKYRSNIGSHPFIAGLYQIVYLQLNPSPETKRKIQDPSYVVRWKFRGSVLMEACSARRGCSVDDDDDLAYVRKAIQVLFSFLILIKDDDVERGASMVPLEHNDFNPLKQSGVLNRSEALDDRTEPMLSVEVDKYISNANLRRILAVLPNPKHLDARATGSVEVMDSPGSNYCIAADTVASKVIQRKNVDGSKDEHWPWFAQLEFCNLL